MKTDRILKDIDGNMSDHLQNHIHLTNCIHLKNHLHNRSPFPADKSLLRDLTALQKSRHLRDPSGSPSAVLHSQEEWRERSMKEKRRRFRSGRRNRSISMSAPAGASSSVIHCNEQDDGNNPRCGIPWNWSRIHERGKSFLSQSRSKRESSMSENSSSSFPLLLDASGSQESSDHERFRIRQHQSLTQKYMPRTFSDVIGQNLVVQALSNAVLKKKIGSLYVFHGPHGTGKSACARIFARALNCTSTNSSKPCGLCDSCIENETNKNRNVREIGPVSKINYQKLIDLFDRSIISSKNQSQYVCYIFDECDAMPSDCFSAIMKIIHRAPNRVAIILVCSSLDSLPHVIVSRCQKFHFTKLKDADIVYALQMISRREDLEVDKDALKLIASRSDGSLRDAEMTLEQLSLLGQRISLCLVQELIGLISDEKLLDLLDFALSADTINTVKNVRDITASGVEPLALMSQLATVITDILAGSYGTVNQRSKRKFFQRQALSKEDMEKLRQALKTLSEAEKQLRVSSERMTWLTAALLQLAPDHHYTNPVSSADTTTTSSYHSPPVLNDSRLRSGKTNVEDDASRMNEIWFQVLENIKIKSLKEFMYKEGKMVTLSYGEAPTVQLLFNSQLTKSVVEKFRSRILQAFEAVLKAPVTIEIRQGSRGDTEAELILLRVLELSALDEDPKARLNDSKSDEIVEVEDESQREIKNNDSNRTIDGGDLSERNQSLSIVRKRVSLGVILHGDECSENGGLAQPEAVSIADKLEQENLRLEPRSRRLLCWNPPRITRPTLSCLKIRRKPQSLTKLVSCGRCHSARSPQ